jgi:hypothetical protein
MWQPSCVSQRGNLRWMTISAEFGKGLHACEEVFQQEEAGTYSQVAAPGVVGVVGE